MNYTAKQGKQLIKSRNSLSLVVLGMWEESLPPKFLTKLERCLKQMWSQENLGFTRLLWH